MRKQALFILFICLVLLTSVTASAVADWPPPHSTSEQEAALSSPPQTTIIPQTSQAHDDIWENELSEPLSPRAYLPFVITSLSCSPNPQEEQIALFMIQDPEQQRPSLTCHPILTRVARERAEDMAQRRYFDHVNPDGYGPNYLVRQAGYVLPSYYDPAPDANNIESIAGGYPTPEAVWQKWTSSATHRDHLLGLHPFWAEQIEYGIGYTYDPNSPYGHYWVVITAKRGP